MALFVSARHNETAITPSRLHHLRTNAIRPLEHS